MEDLIDIVVMLPYSASLALALISYLIFHHFASGRVEVVAKPGSMYFSIIHADTQSDLYHQRLRVAERLNT